METKTVNTELWYIGQTHNFIDAYMILTKAGLRICSDVDDDDAALIVTAVNACKTINPDNPLNAAKAIGLLYENLVRILDRIDEGEFKDNFPSAYIRAMNAIKQATSIFINNN